MNKTDVLNRIKEAVAGAWGPTGNDPLEGERAKDIVSDVCDALALYDEKPMQLVRVVFIEYPDHPRDIVTVLEDTSFEALDDFYHRIDNLNPDLRGDDGLLASTLRPVYPNGLVPKRPGYGGPHYRDLSTGEDLEP